MTTKQILCIDDDQSILFLRKVLLESCGFKTLTATSGKEGLQVFKSNAIDAVVVDYSMPEMDGEAVSVAIKKANSRTPVIMLSAYPLARKTVFRSVDAFIDKGETPEVLLTTLRTLVTLRGHSHSELQSEYVVFADLDRRYLDCSDGVCKLLGYSRLEILELTVDDLSYRTEETAKLFNEYLERGRQDGEYILKHKDGSPVFIRYTAHIFPDGCVAAIWYPAVNPKSTNNIP